MIAARGMHPHTPKTEAICAVYRTRVGAGEKERDVVRSLAVDYDVQRPAIWKQLRAGGVVPAYKPKVEGYSGRPKGGGTPGFTAKRTAASLAHSLKQPERISTISAGPAACLRCGSRFGCKHMPARG